MMENSNITILEGDLFDTHADVIAHQVNCLGVMGSGVAKQIKEKYPLAFQKYSKTCKELPIKEFFGTCEIVDCDTKLIANLFAQKNFGNDGNRYTNYEAFFRSLKQLNDSLLKEYSIAFPYNIGCDRGGADWDIIHLMIQKVFKNRKIYIYRLEKNNV